MSRCTRHERADERLGHAPDDLRTAVIAGEADKTCPDADTGRTEEAVAVLHQHDGRNTHDLAGYLIAASQLRDS